MKRRRDCSSPSDVGLTHDRKSNELLPYFEGNDKKVCQIDTAAEAGLGWPRSPGPAEGRPLAAPGPGERAGQTCPILDTHTPDRDTKRKPFRTASDKRCFSRMMLGLHQPGRYYFWTLTSSNESPSIEIGWRALRRWLKRHYGKLAYMQVLTREGNGVIHLVVRLRHRQKNIDVRALRAFWQESHKATQIKVKRVQESKKEDLANYLSDQRKKQKMGAEFSWQPQIIKWGWSEGWIPQGFTKKFGKWWQMFSRWCVPPGQRDKELHNWIQKCHKNQAAMKKHGWKMYRCCEVPTVEKVLHCELLHVSLSERMSGVVTAKIIRGDVL